MIRFKILQGRYQANLIKHAHLVSGAAIAPWSVFGLCCISGFLGSFAFLQIMKNEGEIERERGREEEGKEGRKKMQEKEQKKMEERHLE